MKGTQKVTGSPGETVDPLVLLLESRFRKHPHRHPGLPWETVLARLQSQPHQWAALARMEETGGEPDVITEDPDTGEWFYADCSPETPKGRTSVCYDRKGWESRKEHRPAHNAQDLAREMGIGLLTEVQYRRLQELEPVDTKTSSWIQTPASIRDLGGALFGDRRYGQVFIYHNGAQSYYSSRAFRGCLRF